MRIYAIFLRLITLLHLKTEPVMLRGGGHLFANTFLSVLVKYKAQQFIEIIKETGALEEFDIDIYFKIIEKMIVFEGNKIIVTLLDGTEVEVVIE
jgi:hypothetical protein